MSLALLYKLLGIFAMIALGWLAGRGRWLEPASDRAALAPGRAAQVLSEVTFLLFVPALLFRTMVLQDLRGLPWGTLVAYFLPTVAYLLVVYLACRRRVSQEGAAAPATRTVAATYGNAVQLGIPVSAALFGERGLALHLALMSLHGLLLLTTLTVLVELDLARSQPKASVGATALTTARKAVLHPVTLPLIAGVAWNLTGWGLHPAVDEALAVLARAVVPVCLVLIGLNLAQYGLKGHLRGAFAVSLLKLLVLPALVLTVAWFGFGLRGTTLGVVVMMAALPVGSNALIFASRYRTLEAEATAAIVTSTLAYMATAAGWLAVLALLGQSTP